MMSDLLIRAQHGETLRVMGLMSGTSLDGVDVAVIETDGEQIRAFGPSLTTPYRDEVREAVRQVLGAEAPTLETEHAGRVLTRAHRDAIMAFFADVSSLRPADIDVIGFHGQTITHRPQKRFTWQIGDGAWLARETGRPVIADFRSADVAAGGQGAPFVPVYHQALVRRSVDSGWLRLPVAVLNIGGVANVTWIGADGTLLAFDTGPGNAPLDDWVRQHGAMPFDRDGQVSRAGTVDRARIAHFLSSAYFSVKPPKSLDRNDFSSELVRGLSLADGAATLAWACAAAIAAAVGYMPQPPTAWLVCGGGAKNPSIIKSIENISNISVEQCPSEWTGDMVEAQAFGFLAARSLRGLPLSFPTTTGVPAPLQGGRLFTP
jgi:anhydro-N-acetylmuramic acid kinase